MLCGKQLHDSCILRKEYTLQLTCGGDVKQGNKADNSNGVQSHRNLRLHNYIPVYIGMIHYLIWTYPFAALAMIRPSRHGFLSPLLFGLLILAVELISRFGAPPRLVEIPQPCPGVGSA